MLKENGIREKISRKSKEAVLSKKALYLTNELSGDCARFIDALAEKIEYQPVAELHLGHEAVKELLALSERMKLGT